MSHSNPNDRIPMGATLAGKVEYWAGVGDFDQTLNAIREGYEVNATSDGGYTALHAAAENNRLEIVRLLIEHGASPSQRLATGETPFDLAKIGGYDAIVKYLMAEGVWRYLGRIIDTRNVESRGPAILINLKFMDFPTDLVVEKQDRIRILQFNQRSFETIVCGVEFRPMLTLLLPEGIELQGSLGAAVAISARSTSAARFDAELDSNTVGERA